jgi:hypothetical protein
MTKAHDAGPNTQLIAAIRGGGSPHSGRAIWRLAGGLQRFDTETHEQSINKFGR